MTTRAEVQAEAREWIGTPFRHQGRLKHVVCDCIGLIWKVGENSGACIIDPTLAKPYLGYPRQPNPRRMRTALETFWREIPKEEAGIGDFVWMHWRQGLPMHLAILSEYQGRETIIHALESIGKVCEHSLTDEWKDKITSYWRYPLLKEV